MVQLCVLVSVVAYLLGSIPVGLLLMRIFRGIDIRQTGSGNIGATNVARTSSGLGLLTLVLDVLKGYVAVVVAVVLAGQWGVGPQLGKVAIGLAALAAVLGHTFSVWLRFKGGKGVATSLGAFLALMPVPTLVGVAVFAVVVAVSRFVSLASMTAAATLPIIALLMLERPDRLFLPFMVAAAMIIIGKHHQNIRRLLTGTEHPLHLRHR
jgi:glycerol-3-phosphate acyltransferase PlsY